MTSQIIDKSIQRKLFRDANMLSISVLASAVAGLVCWILAARLFTPVEVGRAAGMVTAMLLVSGLGQMNLGSALHRFVPGSGVSAKPLIFGSYVGASAWTFILGLCYVEFFGSSVFANQSLLTAVGFGLCAVLWSIFTLQDQVLMGFGESGWVAGENAAFGVGRVVMLLAAVGSGTAGIFGSWLIPVGVMVAVVSTFIVTRGFKRHVNRSASQARSWDIPGLRTYVAANYVGHISELLAGGLVPLLVLSEEGPRISGVFYIAWMISTNLNLISDNFAISLVVQGAQHENRVPELIRAAMRRLVCLVGPVVIGLLLFAHPALRIFGDVYATSTSGVLRLLALGTAARIVINLYVAVARLRNAPFGTAGVPVVSNVGLVIGCYIGLNLDGLTGLGWGFLVSQCIVALTVGRSLASSAALVPVSTPASTAD